MYYKIFNYSKVSKFDAHNKSNNNVMNITNNSKIFPPKLFYEKYINSNTIKINVSKIRTKQTRKLFHEKYILTFKAISFDCKDREKDFFRKFNVSLTNEFIK